MIHLHIYIRIRNTQKELIYYINQFLFCLKFWFADTRLGIVIYS